MTFRPYQIEAMAAIVRYEGKAGLVCMPTGTGKSRIIAGAIEMYPRDTFLCLTHVKELIRNNYETLLAVSPHADAGIYSAGLGRKQVGRRVIFGGIASVVHKVEQFTGVDRVIIDEAHLVPPKGEGLYRRVLNRLLEANPNLWVLGLTATAYRMGQGSLTDSGLFQDIIYDITGREQFNRLIEDGYLCMAVTRRTETAFDLSSVPIRNGDFAGDALQQAVNHQDITSQVVSEIVRYGANRRSWMLFSSGVRHAENVAEMLRNYGVPAAHVSGEMPKGERDAVIEDFKSGSIRAIVNHGVLTTGFDHPPVDLIAMLRPTMSPGLWVQMVGRGLRPSPATGKENCLVLDFGRNTERLGPVNDPVIPKGRGGATAGPPPIRVCPECFTYLHLSVKVCTNCGYVFPVESKVDTQSALLEVIAADSPNVQWFDVDRPIYTKQISATGQPMLKVTYVCGAKSFREYVLLEHSGVAQKVARAWWKKRMGVEEAPPSVVEALGWTSMLYVPKRIKVWTNKKPYPVIEEFEF